MIRVEERPDPLTAASESNPSTIAESDAYRYLFRELVRYGKRETAGRSLLIAGHRGAGKTTLVRQAIQNAQREVAKGKMSLWPTLISLHGPDLLGGEAVEKPRLPPGTPGAMNGNGTAMPGPAKNGDGGPTAGADPAAGKGAKGGAAGGDGTIPPRNPAAPATASSTNGAAGGADAAAAANATAYRLLAKSLHRALMDELAAGFRRHVAASTMGQAGHELAAAVQHDLEHAPDLATLREYWRRAGALETGVLTTGRNLAHAAEGPARGYCELVAAAMAIEAFRVIAGTDKKTQNEGDDRSRNRTSTRTTALPGKELFAPLLGIATGGLVGTVATSALHQPTLLSSLVGLGAGIAAALTVNSTLTTTRNASLKLAQEFTWDTSISSLERMLPVLVDRLLDIGIAPIFVIDELDKVPNLRARMGTLVSRLKHFATEKAFFCFLTNRDYYESLTQAARSGTYTEEHTFFSDRLYVLYKAQELRAYARGLLTSDTNDDNEELDLDFLSYLTTHASRMQPIELRRAISRFTDSTGRYTLEPGDVRSLPGYNAKAFIQVAIEHVLGNEETKRRMEQDSQYARLLLDTLYYPSVKWDSGELTLDVSQTALEKYLEERLNAEIPDGQVADAGAAHPAAANRITLRETDKTILHERFTELLGHLRNPGDLMKKLSPTPPLATALLGPLLAPEKDGKSLWLRDQHGMKLRGLSAEPTSTPAATPSPLSVEPARMVEASAPPGAGAPPPAASSAADIVAIGRKNAEWIKKVAEALAQTAPNVTLDSLATRCRILEVSPAWTSVASAIARFEIPGGPLEPLPGEIAMLAAYQEMIRSRAQALQLAFALAALLSPVAGETVGIAEVLVKISSVIAIDELGAKELAAELQRLLDDLLGYTAQATQGMFRKLLTVDPTEVVAWLEALRKLQSEIGRPVHVVEGWAAAQEHNAGRWATFLRRTSRARQTRYEVTAFDLVSAVRGSAHLWARVQQMPLGVWAKLLEVDSRLIEPALPHLGLTHAGRPAPDAVAVLVYGSAESDIMKEWKVSTRASVVPWLSEPASPTPELPESLRAIFMAFAPAVVFIAAGEESKKQFVLDRLRAVSGRLPPNTLFIAAATRPSIQPRVMIHPTLDAALDDVLKGGRAIADWSLP